MVSYHVSDIATLKVPGSTSGRDNLFLVYVWKVFTDICFLILVKVVVKYTVIYRIATVEKSDEI